jgi:hypothetical protein
MAQMLVLSPLILVLAFCIPQIQGTKEGGALARRKGLERPEQELISNPWLPVNPTLQAVMEVLRTAASSTAKRRFPTTLSAATGSKNQA